MQFTSAAFLILFLPVTVAAFWLVPARLRVPLLLVASYTFYLSWKPIFGLLLAGSTVANYALARRMPEASNPKRVLTVAVALNLVVLAFFKYAGLLTSGGADLVAWLHLADTGSFDGLQVLLPLAISFFTFEMISAQVDVYRGDVRVDSFLYFATYKAFFPKLISGPITRYREFGPQLRSPAPLTFERFQSGLGLFALGLLKKLAIANNLALLVNPVFDDPGSATAGAALLAILAFGLQIYMDFSAYTDMARGCSRLLGLELPQNFRWPYAATSPQDFWRRWHMSLSRWLRDYLYIPLGGNRKGRAATYRNLMITMALGGLWHGAAWHFAVWGVLHGILLAGNHALPSRARLSGLAGRTLGWAFTLSAVLVAWVFFRATSLGNAVDVLAALGHAPLGLSDPTPLYASVTVVRVLAVLVLAYLLQPVLPRLAERSRALLRGEPRRAAAALAVATVACWTLAGLLAPASNPPFIYFRF